MEYSVNANLQDLKIFKEIKFYLVDFLALKMLLWSFCIRGISNQNAFFYKIEMRLECTCGFATCGKRRNILFFSRK